MATNAVVKTGPTPSLGDLTDAVADILEGLQTSVAVFLWCGGPVWTLTTIKEVSPSNLTRVAWDILSPGDDPSEAAKNLYAQLMGVGK